MALMRMIATLQRIAPTKRYSHKKTKPQND
jgi:hypothetical protein